MIYIITPFEHTFKAWCSTHKLNHKDDEVIRVSKKEDLEGRHISEEDAVILVTTRGFRPTDYQTIYSEIQRLLAR